MVALRVECGAKAQPLMQTKTEAIHNSLNTCCISMDPCSWCAAWPEAPGLRIPVSGLGRFKQGMGEGMPEPCSHRNKTVVEGNDKKRARLNCMAHLLSQISYAEVPHEPVVLPAREKNPDYFRRPVPAEMFVPSTY